MTLTQSIENVYVRVFQKSLSTKMKKFVLNLSWLTFSMVISGFLGFVANLLAGRFLGPEEYGKFGLVLSVSQFLIIPMLFGINTAVAKYASELREGRSRMDVLGTGTWIVFLLTCVFATVYLFLKDWLSGIFSITNELFVMAVILAIATVLQWMGRSWFQGLKKFIYITISEIAGSVLMLALFIFLLFIVKDRSFQSYAYANVVLFLTMGIVGLWVIRSSMLKKPTITYARQLFRYGGLAILGGLFGSILGNVDRVILSHYHSYEAVGLYTAYFYVSNFIIGKFLMMFLTVFFPEVSSESDKGYVLTVIQKFSPFLFVGAFLFNLIAIPALIFLYGSEYQLIGYYVPIFALSSAVNVIFQIYMWLLNAEGERGVLETVKGIICASCLAIVLNILLIPSLSVTGAALSAVISNIVLYFYFRNKAIKFYGQP